MLYRSLWFKLFLVVVSVEFEKKNLCCFTAMPLPHIQDPNDEDDVQLLPINKSVCSGQTLKPSA